MSLRPNPRNGDHLALPGDSLAACFPEQSGNMCSPKRNSEEVDKLVKYHHQDQDLQAKNVEGTCSAADHQSADTAKVLDAIATLQGTLTAKKDEVKIDISLLRQDLSKVKDRVTEAETRIGAAEDILHPLTHTTEDLQRQIQQLHAHQDDMENRLRRCNLRFIGLPEKAEGTNPAEYLESLLIQHFGREAFSVMFAVERAHRIPAKPPPVGAPPQNFYCQVS